MKSFSFTRQLRVWLFPVAKAGVALGAVLAVGVAGCWQKAPDPGAGVTAVVAALNANPQTTNFAVYAQNSATLRDRVAISGGDVGVRLPGAGPLLVSDYELALVSDAHVDISHNVIANRLLLQNRARVGDVQVNRITNQGGFYSHQYPFPSVMPALPPTAPVSPGSAALVVNASSTVAASPGNYGAASIANRGVLRLRSGAYHLASLQLDNDARIEALGPVQIRVAGRFAALDRVGFGSAAGVTLTAGDLRIEISGKNGSSGSLTDSPKAAIIGSDSNIHGVMLVPNGTLQTGQRTTMVGAYLARDVYIDMDSQVTFQNGVGPSGCLESCDDGNPCTTDTCAVGVCLHTPAAAGTGCGDGNGCNGAEACDGAGNCRAGIPIYCVPSDQCHTAGICNPATGACSNPAKPDGAACNDANACTQIDTCQAGSCLGSDPVLCSAADQCHDVGVCDPGTGACSNPPKTDGAPCNDGNACSKVDTCQGGTCSGASPVACAALDQCHDVGVCDPGTGACSNPPKTDGAPCNDGNACSKVDTCQGGTCSGASLVTCVALDQCHAVGTCDPSTGACSSPGKPDGTLCSDGDLCTQIDTCQAGSCIGANPVVCPSPDQCHDVGACDHATGSCSNPAKADNTPCDDGNPFTQGDACQAGVCVPRTTCADVQAMGTGYYSTCTVWTGGRLWCWGYNRLGQLGIGTMVNQPLPVPIGVAGWGDINVGAYHACGIKTDQSLWCWGYNLYGQLGIGTSGATANQSLPVSLQGSDWAKVTLGNGHTCATKTDGSLWCWGSNAYGQLGATTAAKSANPVQVSGNDWTDVVAGSWHTCATKTDGSLWCWGYNATGQLGIGTNEISKPTPTAVEGSGWARIGAGLAHTCATKTDGTLWCWGYNQYGQLGDEDESYRLSPGQLAEDDWASVGAGYGHTCALKSNGTLWCWGLNVSGELGDGTFLNLSSPTQVGAATWTRLSVGLEYTCGVQTDKTLWCWGNNGYGQLGDGSAVNQSAPTQIGRGGCAAVCGDGILDWAEPCDDGNLISGDGCSATCQTEVCGSGAGDGGQACTLATTDPRPSR